MKPRGAYKIRTRSMRARTGARTRAQIPSLDDATGRDPIESLLARVASAEQRTQRIVDSLREEIREGGEQSSLRIRRVFSTPREIYRLELERPDLGYQRTTLLGREALETLLEADDVRAVVETVALSA